MTLFEGSQNSPREPRLDIQLKSTYQNIRGERSLAFPLDIPIYNRLRKDTATPRILVVVVTPRNLSDWLSHSEQNLILQHCGYWLSLKGANDSNNTTSHTVSIPRTQTFDPVSLGVIMQRIDQGGQP